MTARITTLIDGVVGTKQIVRSVPLMSSIFGLGLTRFTSLPYLGIDLIDFISLSTIAMFVRDDMILG